MSLVSAAAPAAGPVPLSRFLLLTVIAGLSIGMAKVVTTLYAVDLGADTLEIGIIGIAQSLGLLVMSLPVGMLADRLGPRRLFITGSLVAGVAYLATPLGHSIGFLMLMTLLAGLAIPLRFISLNAVFLARMAADGANRAGWFRATHMGGVFLLGPVLGAALITALGFAVTWWSIALLFLAGAPLALIGFGRPDPAAGNEADRPSFTRRLRLLLTAPGIAHAALTDLLAQAALLHFSLFITPLAIRQFSLDEALAAQLVAAQGIAFVLALFTGGILAARLGPKFGLILAALVAIGGEAILALAGTASVLWIGALLIGAGLGLVQLVNLTRFARLSAVLGGGGVAGILALTGPLGGLLGAALGGGLGQILGPQAGFAIFIPVLVLLAALAALPSPPLPA